MITKEQALTGNNFRTIQQYPVNPPLNTHTKPRNYRRNGKTKVLKRTPEYFRIPVKRGLYAYGYISNNNAHLFEAI